MIVELNYLFSIIKDELLAAGFTKRPSCCVETDQSMWMHGNELVKDENGITGFSLTTEKVYHSNGANRDISYRLDVMKWNKSSGCSLGKLKVSSTQTEKTTRKKIKNFIKNYLQIINNVV